MFFIVPDGGFEPPVKGFRDPRFATKLIGH